MLDGSKPPWLQRVAAQHAPPGQDQRRASRRASGSPGPRIGAARMVLAAGRHQRGDEPADRAGSVRGRSPSRRLAASSLGQPRLGQHVAERLGDALLAALARSSPGVRARDEHEVVALGQIDARAQNASRSRRFTRLRSTAPPDLAPDRDARGAEPRPPRGGTSGAQTTRCRLAMRTPCAVDAIEVGRCGKAARAAARRPALRAASSLRREPLAALVAPALDDAGPPRVRMRARNPWVRARLRFFGW